MTIIVLDVLKIQNLSDSSTSLSQNLSEVSLGTPNFVRKISFQNVLFNPLILLKQTKLQGNKRLNMSLVSHPLNTIYNTMRTTKYLFPKNKNQVKYQKSWYSYVHYFIKLYSCKCFMC